MSQELPIVAVREPKVTVFVSIGNVGSALNFHDWSSFHREMSDMLVRSGAKFHDELFSSPTAAWQTACWCIDVKPGIIDRLKGELAAIGAQYGRGLIGWNEIASSVLLG